MICPALAVAQVEARSGRLTESVDAHVRMATAAAEAGAKVIVFPELSLTGYSRALTTSDAAAAIDRAHRPLADVSRMKRITIVAGAPLASAAGLHVASFVICPDGVLRTYTKQHLHEGEDVAFVPGSGGALLVVEGTKIGLAICADANHASHAADAARRGASVYAASCFFTPTGYQPDCERLRSYAQTHRIVVLMASFTGACGGFEAAGGSAIWDDAGHRVAAAPTTGEGLVVAERRNGRWVGHTRGL